MREAPKPHLTVGVTEFTQRLRVVFERRLIALHNIGVTGELVSYSISDQGNVHFTLKQDENTLVGFAWSRDATTFPKVHLGTLVTAVGTVTIYPAKSAYQLTCLAMIPSDERGRLALLYAQLKNQYEKDGLFDVTRKIALPKYPLCVAVVSSRKGKGTDDFIDQMRAEAPFVRVILEDTQVQGAGADESIAAAIRRADGRATDLVVVLRGGGAFEELFTFNLEPVVRAIALAQTPIVTSIGHNADRHLADDVADAFFATPTAAIKTIVASWVDGLRRLKNASQCVERSVDNAVRLRVQRLDSVDSRLQAARMRAISRSESRLRSLSQALERHSPATRMRSRRGEFAELAARLRAWPQNALVHFDSGLRTRIERRDRAHERAIGARRTEYTRAIARLDAVDPRAPLARGYAIVEFEGHAVMQANTLKTGAIVRARLARGSLSLRVEEIEP